MYGLIAKLTFHPGKREEVIALLSESSRHLPGCFSYIIADDVGNGNTLWVTEVWESKTSHDASLTLRSVQSRVQALIASSEKIAETIPVAGLQTFS